LAAWTRPQHPAHAARQDLRRIGLADDVVEVSVPEPGRYKAEYHESSELGRGAAIGGAIGAPVGSAVAIGVLLATVPEMSTMAAIGLGILAGSFWGLFYGGLGGVVLKMLAHADNQSRRTIAADSQEILLIAEAGSQTGIARKIMRKHGVSCFLESIPDRQPRRIPMPAANEPAGFGIAGIRTDARSEVALTHGRAPESFARHD
jgi:hypothetical protein